METSPYPVIIAGDFNAGHIAWTEFKHTDSHCESLYNYAISNGLDQSVNFHTCFGFNID